MKKIDELKHQVDLYTQAVKGRIAMRRLDRFHLSTGVHLSSETFRMIWAHRKVALRKWLKVSHTQNNRFKIVPIPYSENLYPGEFPSINVIRYGKESLLIEGGDYFNVSEVKRLRAIYDYGYQDALEDAKDNG